MNSSTRHSLVDEFREVMAGVCTPVSVVTALAADGRPHGTTVSAFASLSMAPPMALVSLDRGSDLLALVRETGRFGINVLGSEQSAWALRFAGKGADKFTGVPWDPHVGVPRLPGCGGFLGCTVADLVDGGDHVIVLGEVVAAEAILGRPLTYHSRMFGTHAALEEMCR
ncbi:flavin reductase family protein [Streptomyces fulvoviolaceus]|uniref:flavin reductase family protein n=1 Tax=Streptomyces fulvoviolaceus TaxID=285535 RepID=UPI0004C59B29|nr:flavin reductase family protein [Streptomyces fulvoviolaceus]